MAGIKGLQASSAPIPAVSEWPVTRSRSAQDGMEGGQIADFGLIDGRVPVLLGARRVTPYRFGAMRRFGPSVFNITDLNH